MQNTPALANLLANTPNKRKRPPPQLTPARLRELKRQQDARWKRPGVGTDTQGNPY